MSRIGKQPIPIPSGVKAELVGQLLKVEGPKGKLERTVSESISMKLEENELVFTRTDDSKTSRSLHGLERSLANNMVVGVSEGYAKELELIGVGFRAEMKGKNLNLGLGYSHDIEFECPEGVKASITKEGREQFVRIEGIDKQLVGQVAAKIRSLRSPEPYKGKGVRYRGEQIRRKAGKAGKK